MRSHVINSFFEPNNKYKFKNKIKFKKFKNKDFFQNFIIFQQQIHTEIIIIKKTEYNIIIIISWSREILYKWFKYLKSKKKKEENILFIYFTHYQIKRQKQNDKCEESEWW